MKSKWLFGGMMALSLFTGIGGIAQSGHGSGQNFPDTLIKARCKTAFVYTLRPGKDPDPGQLRIGDLVATDSLRLSKHAFKRLIGILKDTSNYFPAQTTKSCAFLPVTYFKLPCKSHHLIHLFYSKDCAQLALVPADFKTVLEKMDLSEKGLKEMKAFVETMH